MNRQRVVVTGSGIVSPLGNDIDSFFKSLRIGYSGIGRLQAPFADDLDCTIAAQANFDPLAHFARNQAASLDRSSQFALVAAEQAVLQAGLPMETLQPGRCGVAMGTGMGGSGAMDEGYARLYRDGSKRLKPFTVLMGMNNAAAAHVAMAYHFSGANLTYSTACSSSAVAIGEAMRLIRHGYADCMLAGGTEALLTYGTIRAWEALRTLAKEDEADPPASCKPFSANRSGLVLGEGAAMVVLESLEHATARGATILAEIVGYGYGNDSEHLTQPSVSGQSQAMASALADAALAPEAIGYINAHGTGTLLNDRTETAAIKKIFGADTTIPVSSTKSMHGHLMGAAGAVEFIACVEALRHQCLPPTMHLRVPDPECDLDYVANASRPASFDCAMSNSFAFGGTSAVLIARRS
ncbi:MAG: beta-ketoacyl-[acyl-carrier-protein] synthase family protein [Betaproteobacteria bacterium]